MSIVTDKMVSVALEAYWTDQPSREAGMRAALEASLSRTDQGSGVVKQLEWGPYPNEALAGPDVAVANVDFKSAYQVQRDPWGPGYIAYLHPTTYGTTKWWESKDHATLEAAKSAAQSDFETRIRSSLVAAPAAGEAVAWLTTWWRDGEEWVNAHANEVTAVDEARRHKGTVTPLYAHPLPEEREGWRDIESAPKDGSEVLVWDEHSHIISQAVWKDRHGHFLSGGWQDAPYTGDSRRLARPTHWMPLPTAPIKKEVGR